MANIETNMEPQSFADLMVPPVTATILWLTEYLQPILQILILILTLAFLGLGVALRWKLLKSCKKDLEGDI